MKLLILAAGQGTRLRPLTDNKPKCMVEYEGKSIIDYILEVSKLCNIDDVAVVGGYKFDVLKEHLKDENITYFENRLFDNTNMVSTLFSAKEFFNDDIIISYSDIIYTKEILEELINSRENFSVVADRKWFELWSMRMDNPLLDAETFKTSAGNIIELGKLPKDISEIEGQYIGLLKISKKVISEVSDFYFNLNKDLDYDGNNFDNMYMTSFIQLIIDNLMDVKPVYIDGGWIEIDTIQDLNNYKNLT